MVAKKSQLISLVIINLIPIIGVLYFGWNIYNLLSLYWLETAILGFFSFIKLFFVTYDNPYESYQNIFWWFLIFIFLLYVTSIFLFMDQGISAINSEKVNQIFQPGFAGITFAAISIVIIEMFMFVKYLILKEFKTTSYRKLYIPPLLRTLLLFVGPSLIILFTVILIPFTGEVISFQLAIGVMILIKIAVESLFATRGYY